MRLVWSRDARTGTVVALGAALALALVPPAVGAEYTIRSLGTLGGTSSEAFAINDARQVVGHASTPSEAATHAFRWQRGRLEDLGTLGGRNSTARDINASGQVVGASDIQPPAPPPDCTSYHTPTTVRAYLLSDGALRDLGHPAPEELDCFTPANSSAEAINDKGQVAGSASGNAAPYTFLYSDRTMQRIGSYWMPGDLNERTEIAGGDERVEVFQGPVVWRGGVTEVLPNLGGYSSAATDINNSGTVVGWSEFGIGISFRHAFRHDGGVTTDLGTLGGDHSEAQAVNDRGWVVGSSGVEAAEGAPQEDRAFLAIPGQPMVDLNSYLSTCRDWVLTTASDINSAGDIVGTGYFRGHKRGFLLSRRAR